MPTRDIKRPILLTPGPTECDPNVLTAMSHVAESHFSQPFCDTFGEVLTMTRKLFQSENPKSQPFIIGGSGSLGWDFTATNFIEPGDKVLCLSTGFFSDAYEMCLSTYGAQTNKLTVPFGAAPDLLRVEEELRTKRYKALVATHVETSTGVLTHLKPLNDLIQRISPETLFIVDAVASLACEDLQFDAWNIDIVLTGSQKAIGCPPGLSIIMVSERAVNVAKNRKGAPATWYASFNRWLPVMQKYERKEPSYFATPPTQVVRALHASLTSILSRPLQERFKRHEEKSTQVKAAVEELGFQQVAYQPENQSNGVTAFWVPSDFPTKTLIAGMLERGIIITGGMHPEHGTKYVRFGHMGYSAVHDNGIHVDLGIEALRGTVAQFYENQIRNKAFVAQDLWRFQGETQSKYVETFGIVSEGDWRFERPLVVSETAA